MEDKVQDEVVLTVEDLHVKIQTPEGVVHAVRGVDLSLSKGKVLGLVGESGSGKTMTCMSLLRLLPRAADITSGSIRMGNTDLLELTEAEMRKKRGRDLSMIPQNPMTALNPAFTIGQQFIETLRTHQKMSRKEAHQLAVDSLLEMGMAHPERVMKQFPHELSGGMLQRVMTAIAIATQPVVLIADEPTTAIDAVNQHQVLEHLRDLSNRHELSIVFVSHDWGAVTQVADEVAVMYRGFIVERAPLATLLEHAMHPYTHALLEARLRLVRRKHQIVTSIAEPASTVLGSPAQCPFLESCPLAETLCGERVPELTEYEENHWVRCHVAGKRAG